MKYFPFSFLDFHLWLWVSKVTADGTNISVYVVYSISIISGISHNKQAQHAAVTLLPLSNTNAEAKSAMKNTVSKAGRKQFLKSMYECKFL